MHVFAHSLRFNGSSLWNTSGVTHPFIKLMNSEEKLYQYSFYTGDNFNAYGKTLWMEFSDNSLTKLMTVSSIKLPMQ